jgi:acyl-coenzyme A synthetase/AMP-(fatty) acid ligase
VTALTASGQAVIFGRTTNHRESELATTGDTPTAVAIDEEGSVMFVGRQDRTIQVWDIRSGAQVGAAIDVPSTAILMRHSAASNRLAVGFADGAVQIVHLKLAGAEAPR